MNIIPINEIHISPNRQRQEFDPDALMELTNSIETTGLLQAPVLRQTPKGMTLVAGERRLKAIQDLWMLGYSLSYEGHPVQEGFVPYTNIGELGELEAEEAELDENLRRSDLTWQELASAHERLHKLRQAQAKQSETPVEHTVADTAEELTGRRDGAYHDKVRKELIVAKHLNDPEVKEAKNLNEAMKVLKKKETMKEHVAKAEAMGKECISQLHRLHNIDCLSWMEAYIDCEGTDNKPSVDVILTDPPYGMGAHTFGDGGGKLTQIDHQYDDSYESWKALMSKWCKLSYQVCKPQAHAYVFCDFDRFHELKQMMEDAGWYVFRTPFVSCKPNSGRVPLPDRGPRRQYELVLYAIKGRKPVTHIYPDVISSTADAQMYHGAQKPVELFINLLQRSVAPGDLVLDCFAGTGTILPAAQKLKCKAIALEQEKEYYAICTERLQKLEEEENA